MINKSWLKLFLPALIVMIGFGLLGNAHSRGHSPQHSLSQLHHSQTTSLPVALIDGQRSSHQPPKQESKRPLLFLEAFLEDASEDSELSLEGMLALFGFTLVAWGVLSLESLGSRARMYEVAFSPFASLKQSPRFILLQVFRL